LNIYNVTFVTKYVTLLRRSTVLTLPPQLAFPYITITEVWASGRG